MASVRSHKFPIISFIVCLIAVMILCGLGSWQIDRLAWKNDLQQNLDDAFAKAIPDPFQASHFKNLKRGQVVRGIAVGRLDLGKAIFMHGRIQDGKSVLSVVAPFHMASNDTIIPVEVGCSASPDIKKLASNKKNNMTVTGILRQPAWSFVTPPNISEQGEWWRLDTQELAGYWNTPQLARGMITAENANELVPDLKPCPIEKKLRNDHASYAVFWFIMAGVLSIIWGIRFLKPYLQSA